MPAWCWSAIRSSSHRSRRAWCSATSWSCPERGGFPGRGARDVRGAGGFRADPGVDAGLDPTGPGESGGRARQSGGIGDAIVVLRSTHRFRGALADLAAAIRSGAADPAVEILSGGDPAVQWFPALPLREGVGGRGSAAPALGE